MQIGKNMGRCRRNAGISQARLAALCGYSKGSVAMWEQGYRKPPVTILPTLAAALNCSIEDFFKDEEDKA